MFLDFVRNFLGSVDSSLDFVVVITAAVLLIIFCALILGFFLGAISCLTTKFFKS